MNRMNLYRVNQLLRPTTIRSQCRTYSIMTRIKWRHGLLDPSKQSPNNATSKNERNNGRKQQSVSRPTATATSTTMTPLLDLTHTITTDKQRIPTSELALLRLPRVEKSFAQPENARLLRVASTLINGLVGRSVSDVAARAHTTRTRIHAILTEDDTQIVFLDTPGVARMTGNRMGRAISRELQTASWRSLDAADHLLLMIDAKRAADSLRRGKVAGKRRDTSNSTASTSTSKSSNTPLDKYASYLDDDDYSILRQLQTSSLPVTVVFNKIDLLTETADTLARLEQLYRQLLPTATLRSVVFASALGGAALEDIKFNLFAAALPNSWMFPEDYTTDVSDVVRVERAVSAALYEHLRSYMAYAVKLEMIDWSEKPMIYQRNYTHIITAHIRVLVENENQKRMVIGSKGDLIKSVRQMAETNLGKSLRKMVRLHLDVKHI
ncbi:P-loop containing nucleoside triphosphate hydrolase protein [Syncephalis plumigaleata]|nr:P-loop containing nucleoside triphosphate hydrolase protein [Syncephalis plumigaleata]